MPNIRGRTLSAKVSDTTPLILSAPATLISIYSSLLGENQAKSFADVLLPDTPTIKINLQENPLKAGLVRLFFPNMRKQLPHSIHHRYFLVTDGLDETIKTSIGMANAYVGYSYLVDRQCRIRWAACGEASEEERESLRRCFARLVQLDIEDTNEMS
jgi:ATPase complex subunit ATP10